MATVRWVLCFSYYIYIYIFVVVVVALLLQITKVLSSLSLIFKPADDSLLRYSSLPLFVVVVVVVFVVRQLVKVAVVCLGVPMCLITTTTASAAAGRGARPVTAQRTTSDGQMWTVS